MTSGYDIFRRLETGEILTIASRNSLDEATHLVKSLQEDWPGDYVIEEASEPQAKSSSARIHAADRTARVHTGT